ncbi:MAG TPA: kelch repeat-containing protein [Candidatus Sulfotelmatobacter sp.]|nr:kelch repeat-containing protein [Candidatus Sulfotelmatobacter sp.]
MKSGLKSIFGLQLLAAAVALAACSGLPQSSTSTGGTGTGGGFTIGGTVTGLSGAGLVLQDNGGDNLTITKSGPFVFPTGITSGQAYAVTVATQPTNPAQSCAVTGGSGTATANVTSVSVTCTTAAANAKIGVTVTGLTGTGLVLQDNGGDSLTVTANGSYNFKTTVTGSYAVTVLSQPTAPTQICTVTKGSGIATANVTGIPVSCVNSFTIGGNVTGLVGTGLVLQNNKGDNFTATANGAFAFKTQVPTGTAYSVTVFSEPTGPAQTCTVATGTGSGTATANVTSVAINCQAVTFSVGGTVVGLAGRTPTPPSQINLPLNDNSFEIQNNLGNTLIVPQNGPFQFATSEALNDQFQVSVFHAASSQTDGCTLWDYKGVVTANVTSIVVDCGHNDWTWIDGTKTAGVAGTPQFGALPLTQPTTTPNPLTNTPGARYGAAGWTDNFGNLFLFGGTGFELTGNLTPDTLNAPMNDMWVCVALDNGCQWQLVGEYDSTPVGGSTVGAGIIFNAQHEAQPGSVVVPASRLGASTWTDHAGGNLWLFGGATGGTTGAHFLNDLWEYNMSNLGTQNYTGAEGTWSQVAGSGGVDQAGVYTGGTLNPGSRTNAASWTDASGNFWLFGGHGYDGSGSLGDLNDLWEYTGGHWVWVSGGNTNTVNQKGIYGTQGVAAASNMPGGRQEAAAWADANGNLWLFGGEGEDSVPTTNGILNDLWMYNITNNQWTFVAGSKTANQTGIYPAQPVVGSVATTTAAGTCGLAVGDAPLSCSPISLTGAAPGSRWGASAWIDGGGNLWLFGGWGLDSTGTNGNGALNDVWVYTPNSTPGQLGTWAWIKGSNTGAQNGAYGNEVYPWETHYTDTPGGRSNATSWVDHKHQFWMFGGSGYDSTSTTGQGYLNDMWRYVPYQ